MRRPFAVATVLAAFLAVVFTASSHGARQYTRLALADLSAGRLPGEYIASSFDQPNLAAALSRIRPRTWAAGDPLLALAAAEMKAAGLIDPACDPAIVALDFENLALKYPAVPLVQYRYGAYLLSRLQALAREASQRPPSEPASFSREEADSLAENARAQFARAIDSDPQNSLFYYEIAYSYLVQGETGKALAWFCDAADKTRFESGDDTVLSACECLAALAGVPSLERKIVVYRASQYAPSFLGVRMETLVSALLADALARNDLSPSASDERMMALEDLSDKLFETANVLRQSQASLVTAGLIWRTAARRAAQRSDAPLFAQARKKLTEASYRYVLAGWRRASVGLPAQQAVVELDTPIELRLDFSAKMQHAAAALLLFVVVLLVPAALMSPFCVRVRALRQPALALVTLAAFALLAYSGCFLSLVGERARVESALAARLTVTRDTPAFLRAKGQPASRASYDLKIAREMFPCFDYTLQAGRVLAYVGTRDCLQLLVDSLDSPDMAFPGEVAIILREATGQDFGYRVTASKSSNYAAVRAWRQWWKENRHLYPETLQPSLVADSPRPKAG